MSLGLGRGGKRALAVFTVAAGALLALAGAASGATNLSLVAYSTPQDAYEALIPAFQHTKAGKGVTFSQSYGASGDQSRAVANGLPADVVAFSLSPDVDRLVQTGQVPTTWNQDAFKGIVTRSVVVLTVRKGNPKHIKDWSDLTKPGVDVLIPNWQTSGGAKWDVIAAYGAIRKAGGDDAAGRQYLRDLYKNVSVQDKSARESLQTFSSGKGDVLIGYESEGLPAIAAGNPVEMIRPSYTLLIQNPVAVSGASSNPTQAKAFVQYLWTPEAQTIWAQDGYRPVDKTVFAKFKKSFPTPHGVFKITQFGLGGWNSVTPKFFDPTNGIVTKIASGV